MFLSFNYLTCSILLLFSIFLPLTFKSFSNMKNLISRWRMRRAHSRLSKALDRCSVDDLKRATALCHWLSSTNLVPGDRIILTFDGEHTDVGVLDRMNDYFKDELVSALKDLEK